MTVSVEKKKEAIEAYDSAPPGGKIELASQVTGIPKLTRREIKKWKAQIFGDEKCMDSLDKIRNHVYTMVEKVRHDKKGDTSAISYADISRWATEKARELKVGEDKFKASRTWIKVIRRELGLNNVRNPEIYIKQAEKFKERAKLQRTLTGSDYQRYQNQQMLQQLVHSQPTNVRTVILKGKVTPAIIKKNTAYSRSGIRSNNTKAQTTIAIVDEDGNLLSESETASYHLQQITS